MTLEPTVPTLEASVRRRFEAAWLSGHPEPIEALLPPENAPRYRATLEELVLIELEFWWKRHGQTAGNAPHLREPVLVEHYLRRFPLLNLPPIVYRLLRQERLSRQRFGDKPAIDDYRRRFPTLVVTGEEIATSLSEERAADIKLPTIPGYEVLAVLGSGGMGVVYEALQTDLQRRVALKMVASGARAKPSERIRFRREAEAAAGLQHPHVVQIYAVGEYENEPYLAMELIRGGSLAHRIDGQPQPPNEAARMVETLARAVHWMHQRGVVHRDLKPANVLLTEDGTPKITDFGVARDLAVDSGVTKTGDIVGTPSYMAPEQAEGRVREVGPPADIYALGVILYELLTGQPPFRGETALLTAAMVVSAAPVPPRWLVPQVPRDLETICLKCLRKEPTRRYASAEELAEDLHRFQNGDPIQARPVGWGERLWKKIRRQPAAFALVPLCIIIVVQLVALTSARGAPPVSPIIGTAETAAPTVALPPSLPSFVWDFTSGDHQGTTSKGVESVDDRVWGRPGGSLLRFKEGGVSWMEATFVLAPDAVRRGRWKLIVLHLCSGLSTGEPGYSPVRITLNGREVWKRSPGGAEVDLVPGGATWKRQEWEISAHLRSGANVLRWDYLAGATTHYWLKSFRVTWESLPEVQDSSGISPSATQPHP